MLIQLHFMTLTESMLSILTPALSHGERESYGDMVLEGHLRGAITLLQYNAVLVTSDGLQARIGSLSAGPE
ncbi:MAG: hypothetical protein ACK5NG_06940 [Chthoniobacterales bacterium]